MGQACDNRTWRDLDKAVARFGGKRAQWLDLSTGINPHPYPLPPLDKTVWTALPDKQLTEAWK